MRKNFHGFPYSRVLVRSSWTVHLFGWSPEVIYGVFVEGAAVSYVEDALVVAIALLVGVPLVVALRKLPAFRSLP